MLRSSFLRNICLRPDLTRPSLPCIGLASSSTKLKTALSIYENTLELDSHADTCVLGRDCLIILDHNRPVQVHTFDPSLGSQTFQTISGVLEYQHPITGTKYHLVVNQAIHVPHLDRHLLCPMQCRVNDVTVNDCSKFLTIDPTDHTHAIVINDPTDPTNTAPSIVLPLSLKGVISYLDVSTPTHDSWTNGECLRLDLTSETLTWDPYDPQYTEMETSMTDFRGFVVANSASNRGHNLIIHSLTSTHDQTTDPQFYDALTHDPFDPTPDQQFYDALQSQVVISSLDTVAANGTFLTTRNQKKKNMSTH